MKNIDEISDFDMRIIILTFFLALPSCTTINVIGSSGVEKSWHFGVANIQILPSEGSTVVETKSLGVVNSSMSFNIGYLHEMFMNSGKNCEIVLFYPEFSAYRELEEMIDVTKSVCIVEKE